jgi:hypothetical protein
VKVKLATFNLFQFVAPPYSWYKKSNTFTTTQWLEKTTWIKNQILQMDCDIIGFQEVFSQSFLQGIISDVGFKYYKTVDIAKLCTEDKEIYTSTTVAIASKYPIANIEKVILHTKEPFDFSRIPIKATILLPNKIELLVYICHLKSNRLNEFENTFHKNHNIEHKKEIVSKSLKNNPSESLKQRLNEASSLFIDMKKSQHKPTILLCDLNDKEFSITIEALSNPKYHNDKSQESYILYDASYQYKKDIYNPHPNQKEEKRKSTCYLKGRGSVLDYIFISNHFNKTNKDKIAEVTNYTILDTHLEDNKNGSLLTSDHAQALCELTFLVN